ncbi:hypothetical protein [Bacillus suaedaesalsae]|uniref:Uncharacterized protein n=1 Tax=Bacillus suaedaesalsae TaxID=2810349 RepID=A0ABS2DKV4_9BACI|nr:hypothetical protein [Bacillus suaedaesalsae]MBM6618161.1 hypothetical protein [Bacillus suaedaesalsae]
MDIIQIGSMAVLLKWILLGIAVLLGVIYIKLWRRDDNESKPLLELLTNSLILAFFVWKGSLFLLEPTIVLKSPLSLLYFTGGNNGLIIAIIASIFYFFKKGRMLRLSYLIQTAFFFSFVVLGVYHILSAILVEELRLYHTIIGAYSLLVILYNQLRKFFGTTSEIYTTTILFGFLNIIASFYITKNDHLYLFTFQQWFYIALILVSLIYWNKERKNEESC